MKILLTGHTGFIGKRLKIKLESLHHEVYGINSEFDIWNMDALNALVNQVSPNMIIHCGAISDIKKCEEFPELAYKINYQGSKNLAEIAWGKKINFIYFSSDQVYNKFDLNRKTEETTPDPQNYYGKLKLMAEEDMKRNLSNYHILRIAWQYSYMDKEPTLGRGGFLENIHNAYINKQEFSASQNSYRNFGFVYDTVDVVCKMAVGEIPFGLYNVSSESHYNIYEMAKLAAIAMNCKNTDFVVPHKDERPYNLCADPVALEKTGYKMPSFEKNLNYWIGLKNSIILF